MTQPLTLPTGPFEHVSMDYARLREEGIRLLGLLAGEQWNDFNTHDPGITILEQLCYAITDLGYRIAYSVPDLLGGSTSGLPPPELILAANPVTSADLRTLALDVDGIGNAWVEVPQDPELPFFYHAGSGELRLRPDAADPQAAPVLLRGLQRVVLQATESVTGEVARSSVSARLHAARPLGGDVDVDLLRIYTVDVEAEIEIGVVDDAAAVMATIVDQIESYLAPKAHFISRGEAAARGLPLEKIFEGPLMLHGFVDSLPDPRRTVHTSDLLHAVLDIPSVVAIRSLTVKGAGATGLQRWALPIPAGQVATLGSGSQIKLLRGDLPVQVDPDQVRARRAELQQARGAAQAEAVTAPAPPRPRDLAGHQSIQYQLPAAYGVGPLGLPASASVARRAQARQLQAYLLIFDQLFANALAQLAHVGDLLSPEAGPSATYFTQPVEDAQLGMDKLLVKDPAGHRAWLEKEIETGDSRERRKRFLAHLLARFSEELGDHSLIRPAPLGEEEDPAEVLIADRRAFLRDYPRLSGARGSGRDLTRYGQPDAESGYELRLRHKLGLREGEGLRVVEHVLLRPLVEDAGQLAAEGDPEVPLLAGVVEADPWSLQISVVLEDRGADASFVQLCEQTIVAETPAHLAVRLHWLDNAGEDHWDAFEASWADFQAAHRDYRAQKLRGDTMPQELQLRVRDARDRVVDLLQLGRSYPLRDLPLPQQLVVSPGERATIEIDFSQVGVVYELRDREKGEPVLDDGVPITVEGTGGPVELVTPPIQVDVSYRILAIKLEGADDENLRREAWLRTEVRVVEGVDTTLTARILLPPLDPLNEAPKPQDARLGNWGVTAQVEVLESQEGVTYELIQHAADLSDPTKHVIASQAPVIGTGGTIVLTAAAMGEDVDLRVRGQKTVGDQAHRETRTGVLDLILPLRVRANPATPGELVPAVVEYGAAAQVTLTATQASVGYVLYRARLRDRDFVFGATPLLTIDVPGDGGRTIQVVRPPRMPASIWQDLPELAPAAPAVPGNGGAVSLGIGPPGTSDALILVQAAKQHQTGPLGSGSQTLPSAVQLDAAFALLVRPDPDRRLRLTVQLAEGETTGTLLVEGGQPGVYYDFSIGGESVGLPAYFHQRDDMDAANNKGLDQLRLEVDFAIPRDGAAGPPWSAPPPAPLLSTAPLAAGSVLDVQAHKAMSGLGRQFARQAVLDDVPAVTVEPEQVEPGAEATVTLASSRTGERYQLLVAGEPVGDPVAGTGGAVELHTGPVAARTTFTVAITREVEGGIDVERRVDVVVDVTSA